jgi:hypothetical protein
MNTLCFARYAGIAVGIALLAGCATGMQSSIGAGSVVPSASYVKSFSSLAALTNPRHEVVVRKGRIGHSWMRHVPSGTTLVYASDPPFGTVDVYDYASGSLMGQAAGFTDPFGLCSDKSGDVYVADFSTGMTTELAAGTTTATNSFTTGGNPIGCSVSKKGVLAVTLVSGDPGSTSGEGGVYTFKGNVGTDHPGPATDWPAGFDKKGDLIVEDVGGASPVYELKKGATSWTALMLSGATIGFPGSVELMGKVIGLGDQKPGEASEFGIYSAKLKGTTLQVSAKTVSFDNCKYGQTNVVQWGNISSHPNGLQYKGRVTAVVAGNTDCTPSPIDTWTFPSGGSPSSSFVTSGYIDGATIVNV